MLPYSKANILLCYKGAFSLNNQIDKSKAGDSHDPL